MPEISRFYGIIVYMFANEHLPPHFHVKYSEFEAVVDIQTGNLIKGEIPQKQIRLVQAWVEIHRDELLQNFNFLMQENKKFNKIEPLK